MKRLKILRIAGLMLILSLLIMAIPAQPALAADNISISPSSGKVGDEINIEGANFTASTNERYARIIFSSDEAIVGQYIDIQVTKYKVVANTRIGFADDPDAGTFETDFDVPATITNTDTGTTVNVGTGTYYIYVTITTQSGEGTLIKSKAEFTVNAGALTIDPTSGPVDYAVEIIGSNFTANTNISVKYDGSAISIEDGDTRTDANGNFSSFIYVPESIAGVHDITVTVGSSETTTEFTVEPDIIISPQSGESGLALTVSGTGFARRPREATLYFDNTPLAVAAMDANGSFVSTLTVPSGLTAGVYIVEAEDESQNLATASFTLIVPPPEEPEPEQPTEPETPDTPAPSTTSLDITASGDTVGALIGIGGSGFLANSPVTLKYDDAEVATATTDEKGFFVVTFQVPPSTGGAHIITASDGTNTSETTFTVEIVPPDIPLPLIPELGVKVKSPYTFDWDNVNDLSLPVTYELQVATKPDFSPESIVFEKTALETSQYVMTEADELNLAAQAEAYYWRVRALDGASNPSPWTGPGEFYVAPPFEFPTWALYTILGIGAVVIFGIGYLLGRRTAFYY